jgi:hypothetical protein
MFPPAHPSLSENRQLGNVVNREARPKLPHACGSRVVAYERDQNPSEAWSNDYRRGSDADVLDCLFAHVESVNMNPALAEVAAVVQT